MTEPSAAMKPREPQHGSRRVTVACNVPNGLILRVFEPSKHMEPVLGGGTREVKEYSEVGRVTLKGNARPMRLDPDFVQPVLDKNGFALTVIDAEMWEAFIEQQKNARGEDTFPALINGCIYAVPEPEKAGDRAHRDIVSGLHPIQMPQPGDAGERDPRMPRRHPNIAVGSGAR